MSSGLGCSDWNDLSRIRKIFSKLVLGKKDIVHKNAQTQSNMVAKINPHRNELGKFSSRKELLKVPRLGGKAFEQCAGFLRITDGLNPLDASSVHPEAYPLVEQMAVDLATEVSNLVGNETLIRQIDATKYRNEQFGELTITDILNELRKPGLDPRSEVQQFEFANIYKIEDVSAGMIVPGVVTNITRFGAFVDIGVKQDGLVHVSEISHTYITDPNQVLKLNQHVQVKVTEVDVPRKRIALSIKQTLEPPIRQQRNISTKSFNSPIKTREAVETALPMGDALALLRKKFGK